MKAWVNFRYFEDNIKHNLTTASINLTAKEGLQEVNILTNQELETEKHKFLEEYLYDCGYSIEGVAYAVKSFLVKKSRGE